MKTTCQRSGRGRTKKLLHTDFKALSNRLQAFKRDVQLKLAGSSAGRIALHLALAVMTCHFAWHFQGIARELTRQ